MEILLFSILLCNWNNTAMQYSLCEIDGICTVAYALKSNHTKNHHIQFYFTGYGGCYSI